MGFEKEVQERLDRLEAEAGDDVLYGIDVISLVVGTYGTSHKIYKAMVKGKAISSMVKETMREGSQSFVNILKSRLYMLCIRRENELKGEME